jgi:hypothetical protein
MSPTDLLLKFTCGRYVYTWKFYRDRIWKDKQTRRSTRTENELGGRRQRERKEDKQINKPN